MIVVPPSLRQAQKHRTAIADAMDRAAACMAAGDVEGARAWLHMASLAAARLSTYLMDASTEVSHG